MKTVSKGKLKARMLEYFREIERTGEPLIVTDRGREVLEIRPVAGRPSSEEVLARLRRKAALVEPIDEDELMQPIPESEWEALRDDDPNPW